MRVLFVIPQIDFADHIAIAYLSAVAKNAGHSTFICILNQCDLSSAVKEIKPEVVAYSANVFGFKQIVAAHNKARKDCSFISIMGGPHPTFSPDSFLHSGVDAYCVGEGEMAFRDFLFRIKSGEPFDDIDNIITAKSQNPVRPLVKNLDELPFPDRDLTIANSFLRNTPKKTFYATRGCPFSCKYCCNNYYRKLYSKKGPVVRRFSVERILKEIEHVKSRYCMNFIKFGDDLFAIKPDDWLEEFTDKYKRRISIPFNCYLRIDFVNDAMLNLLKRAGCYSVHLSIDSTSHEVREAILGRKMKNIDLVEQLKLINSYNINTWVNFMLAAPESKLDDDLSTIYLSRKGKVTYASYSTTVPMTGTDLYDYCVKTGYIDSFIYTGDMSGCSRKSVLSCFDKKEKNIRYNIYLIGAIAAKLPDPFARFFIWMIKNIPPNKFFIYARNLFYKFSIENKIFKLREK